MAATSDSPFLINSSPLFRRDLTSPSAGKSKRKQISVSNSSRRFSMSTEQLPTTAQTETTTTRRSPFTGNRRLEKREEAEAVVASVSKDPAVERGSLKDYFDHSKELVSISDGGAPRWLTPLECGPPLSNSPLLLFLPGIIGIGLGLAKQHQRLGKIFEVWCFHIPIVDRTPFGELVKLVERTIRSEYHHYPNRPIYLVGESFGGCLALAVAACNPDIDLVLILANPATSISRSQLQPAISFLDSMPDQLPLSLPYMLSLTGDTLRVMIDSVVKGLPFQQTVEELSEHLGAVSSYLFVLANILPRETLRWKLQMLQSASAVCNSRLHAVKAQTLIIASGKDQLLPSEKEGERLYRALPNCEIRKFNDNGHSLFLEDGIDLVTIIKRAGFYRRGKYIDYVSDYMPPTPTEFQKLYDEFKWIDAVIGSVMLSTLEDGKIVRGFAGIPSEGPVLLVGDHMLVGLDLVPLLLKIFSEGTIPLRVLAHPLIFKRNKPGVLPDLSLFDPFRLLGAVPLSATNLYNLMSSKSHVLLYPGGVREALHRKGEEYKLIWPEQSEFVRTAATFRAKIVPFGVVGEDDIGQLVVDYDDLTRIPYFKAEIEKMTNEATRLRTNEQGEVANQDLYYPGILPKFPGRFYYYFDKPIETKGRKHELRDKDKSQELYLEVKSKVERCIAYLKEKREKDPYRSLLSRFVYQATHGSTSEVPTFEL